MRTVDRRTFLYGISSLTTFFAIPGFGFFETFLKHPKPGYYTYLLLRMMNWYNQTYFDFSKKFGTVEKNYIAAVLKETIQPCWKSPDGVVYKKIFWAPAIQNHKPSFARFSLGFEHQQDDLRELATKIIKKNEISDNAGLPVEKICGLGWDFDKNTFKVYFNCHKDDIPSYITTIKHLPPVDLLPQTLIASLKYGGRELIERRLCFATQNLMNAQQKKNILNFENAVQVMGHYSSVRDPLFIPEYMGINFMRLPSPFKKFCENTMTNFVMGPTTGIINFSNNMSLYYP
ncbi:MAG: hypothetical protein A4S09_10170 [Proteobacteria bacterium SG_bin7]|nr:MAG: hypothetical protein A4S09_10170 [Proteobacteria bacterium SG_bin7]